MTSSLDNYRREVQRTLGNRDGNDLVIDPNGQVEVAGPGEGTGKTKIPKNETVYLDSLL